MKGYQTGDIARLLYPKLNKTPESSKTKSAHLHTSIAQIRWNTMHLEAIGPTEA